MQRFADILEHELSQVGHAVRVIRPSVRLGKYSWPGKLQKWIGYIDKFLLFPAELQRAAAWAEVVHICDHSNSMYVKEVASRPHLVTCHDLLAVRSARGEFPVNPVGFTGKLLQAWITKGLKVSRTIVCVSKATKIYCERILGMPSERFDVIYLGL
ncbi:MAG: glycosyltransferase family 4 protein, partial [Gallionella sp.]